MAIINILKSYNLKEIMMKNTKVTITYSMKYIDEIPPKQGYETFHGTLVWVKIDEQTLSYSERVEFDSSLDLLAIFNEVFTHILQRKFKHNLIPVRYKIEEFV